MLRSSLKCPDGDKHCTSGVSITEKLMACVLITSRRDRLGPKKHTISKHYLALSRGGMILIFIKLNYITDIETNLIAKLQYVEKTKKINLGY